MPNSAVLARSTSTCLREIGSAMGWSMSAVGTLWSSVATVSSGRRTRAAGQAEAVEGLGGGDLVDEVEVDVEQVGLAVGPVDHVLVPDLLGEGPGLGHGGFPSCGGGEALLRLTLWDGNLAPWERV